MKEIETFIPNPLPLRLREVKAQRDRLREGKVVTPTSEEENFDVSNAAQSIILDHVLEQLMSHWTSPEVVGNGNFYNRFAYTYYVSVPVQENRIWIDLVQQVVSDTQLDLNHLTPLEAATLTLASITDFEDSALSSLELFAEISLHAHVVEEKFKERGVLYTADDIYNCLRRSFPALLKRLIALDSVIANLYRHNITQRSDEEEENGFDYFNATLDHRFFKLDTHNNLTVHPDLITGLKKHALAENFIEDHVGRTENRGCPFLASKVQDEFIAFAIEEFIEQHKNFFEVA